MAAVVPQSCKNVWILLSGTSLLKSKEFIGSLIETNASKLINGILYYKKCKSTSLAEVKRVLSENNIEEISAEFIHKLCSLLEVDALQAYELFLSYLLYEYKGTPKSIKNFFCSEKSIQALLDCLWNYYYSERLFTLFSLKQVLSNWQSDSTHPYRQLFHDFLTSVTVRNSLVDQLIAQFNACISAELPSRGSTILHISESFIDKWVAYNVKEQLELLQLLLLYFKHIEHNIDNVLEVLKMFQSHGFTARPLLEKTFSKNSNVETSMKFVGFLESMVFVESLQIGWLCKCMESDISDHHLLKNANKLQELDDLIQSSSSSLLPYGPILLSWMVVRSWELPGVEPASHSLIKHLGTEALNLRVFDYIEQALKSPFFEAMKGTVVESVIKKVIADLLSVTFSIYGLGVAQSRFEVVCNIAKILLCDDSVAKEAITNNDDNGLWMMFNATFENFPCSLKPFLEMCCSMAQTKSCASLLSAVSNLNSYTEIVNMSSVSLLPTANKSTYILAKDRWLFGRGNLVIKSNTTGKVKKLNGDEVSIKWEDVRINGFDIFAQLYKERLNSIVKGYYNEVDENQIEEMRLITQLATKVLETNASFLPHVSEIVGHCFDAFRLFTRFPQLPRLYVSSLLELFSVVCVNEETVTQIWDLISETGFFPYMIGLTKDRNEVMSGQDTNASKIGEIIAFEECVGGEYQLCCAYLKFLCASCSTGSQASFLPAIIHVVSEIFPSHRRWQYKHDHDYQTIGHLCLEIFQNVLCLKTDNEQCQVIVDVCKSSLLNNPSGHTLLEIVITGESVVKQVVEAIGSDVALTENHMIRMVRQSLSVLNRLLYLQEKEKSETLRASAVEQYLFSNNPSKPNMILVLSHYVFQHYDSRLATLAVTLMKRLSKHFPMSMLACLGSEAEAVKDHFLCKLDAVTEDLRLKIGLLDFLSSCVKYQPGLIEMFLNIDSDDDDGSSETSSCLKTVLEILDEKMNAKYFCPPELHCAAVKFLYTFWLQSHFLAINSLKKTTDLWKFVCFPLLNLENFDSKVCGHILRILAREVFFMKISEKEFDTSLVQIFENMKKDDCLTKISNQIFMECSKQLDENSDTIFLVSSWRDFLLSFSKFEPFNVSDECKATIVADVITSLSSQLNQTEKLHHPLLLHLSDILVFTLKKWMKRAIRSTEDWIKIVTEIYYTSNELKESLTVGLLTSINTLLCITLKMCGEDDGQLREAFKDCFIPWCGLFKYSSRILNKQLETASLMNEDQFKLTIVSVSTFQYMTKTVPDLVGLMCPMRNNLIVESLSSLLCSLIKRRVGYHLAESIISVFCSLSSNVVVADLLQINKVTEEISVALQSSYRDTSLKLKNTDFSWLKIFQFTIKFTSSLLVTLKHHYAENAIAFAVTHLHQIERSLHELRETPSSEALETAVNIMSFLCLFVDMRIIWMCKHKSSYDKLVVEVSKTCHSVIAYLIRPNLLQYALTHPSSSPTASQFSVHFTTEKTSTTEDSSKMLKRSISFENDSHNQLNIDTQESFLTLLAYGLNFLHRTSPLLNEVVNSKQESDLLQLDPSFSTPNIDPTKMTSFGSLLYCLSFCVRFIHKNEKDIPAEGSKEAAILKKQLPVILETSISLLVINAFLAQNCRSLKERERQMIRRELKTEMNSILSVVIRQPKRNISGSQVTPAPRPAVNSAFDCPYVKHLLQTIEKSS